MICIRSTNKLIISSGIHPSISEISEESTESDVTLQIPTIITTIPIIERVDSPPSENEHSDDYFSFDDDNNADINDVAQNIVSSLQNDLSRVLTVENNSGIQATNNTPVTDTSENSVRNSPNTRKFDINTPGQSSSKKKD